MFFFGFNHWRQVSLGQDIKAKGAHTGEGIRTEQKGKERTQGCFINPDKDAASRQRRPKRTTHETTNKNKKKRP